MTKELKVSPEEISMRLAWPFDFKLKWAVNRLAEFIIEMDGQVYNTFSGGKDSNTTRDIVDKIYDGTFKDLLPLHIWKKVVSFPKPVNVFANTGLEFPEIVVFVKSFNNIEIVKPLMGFVRVIKEIGVAVGSKKIARMISDIKNPTGKNDASINLYLTGIKRDGTISKNFKLPNRWRRLIDAPFNVSDKCCDIFKKEPFRRYEKKTGCKPIISTTVSESASRKMSYMLTGCNSFEEGKEKCRPLSVFTEQDIWEYANRFNLQHCSVYYDRIVDVKELDGTIVKKNLKAEKVTGCTFCQFGVHLEPKGKPNRIQRLAISHPQYYDIVINKCGLGDIMDYCGLPYKPFTEYKQSCMDFKE